MGRSVVNIRMMNEVNGVLPYLEPFRWKSRIGKPLFVTLMLT